jgi:hypothetical protein
MNDTDNIKPAVFTAQQKKLVYTREQTHLQNLENIETEIHRNRKPIPQNEKLFYWNYNMPARDGHRWTDKEELYLKTYYEYGMSVQGLARKLQRTEDAIRIRLEKVGVLEYRGELQKFLATRSKPRPLKPEIAKTREPEYKVVRPSKRRLLILCCI